MTLCWPWSRAGCRTSGRSWPGGLAKCWGFQHPKWKRPCCEWRPAERCCEVSSRLKACGEKRRGHIRQSGVNAVYWHGFTVCVLPHCASKLSELRQPSSWVGCCAGSTALRNRRCRVNGRYWIYCGNSRDLKFRPIAGNGRFWHGAWLITILNGWTSFALRVQSGGGDCLRIQQRWRIHQREGGVSFPPVSHRSRSSCVKKPTG